MKKSYHSSEVPTRLATMTRRTDEACWVVPRSAGIGAPRDRFRSMLIQHKPDHVPAQQEATHGIRAEVAVRRSVRPSPTTSRADQARECPDGQVRDIAVGTADIAVIASAVRQVQRAGGGGAGGRWA